MLVIFALRNSNEILRFELTDDGRIINKQIYEEALARCALKNAQCSITVDSFHELLQFYMGEGGTLKEYIDHIKKYGFYTPYQPNLDIIIKE